MIYKQETPIMTFNAVYNTRLVISLTE